MGNTCANLSRQRGAGRKSEKMKKEQPDGGGGDGDDDQDVSGVWEKNNKRAKKRQMPEAGPECAPLPVGGERPLGDSRRRYCLK